MKKLLYALILTAGVLLNFQAQAQNKRIVELDELLTPENNDLLPIYDASTDITKSVRIINLLPSIVGEANVGKNIGQGIGIYYGKTEDTLVFKSVKGFAGISVHDSVTFIAIDGSAKSDTGHIHDDRYYTEDEIDAILAGYVTNAANVGTGTGLIYRDKIAGILNLKSIKNGTNITVTNNADDVTISTSAEANTASNLGAGVGVYAQKVGPDLQFKSVTASGGLTTTGSTSTTVNIDGSGLLSSGSVSGTTNYVSKFTGANAIGNSQIFDNGTNIGFGVSGSPSTKFDIFGRISINTGTSSPDRARIRIGDGTGWKLHFSNGAETADFLTIKDNGMIGINESSPARYLDVKYDVNGFVGGGLFQKNIGTSAGSAFSVGGYTDFATLDQGGIEIGFLPQNTTAWTGYGDAKECFIRTGTNAGNLNIINASSDAGDIAFYRTSATTTPTMIIKSDGNVGIGTTSAYGKLTVNGDIALPYGNVLRVHSATYPEIIETGWDGSEDFTKFYTPGTRSGTTRLTLRSNGDITTNGTLFHYGTGLDGSTFQKAAIYADATNGFLFEAPKNASSVKLPIKFAWRGDASPALTLNAAGTVTAASLAGSGTRMVTAAADGTMGTQAITTGTVTSVTVQGNNGVTGSGTVTTSGTITLSHADMSSQADVDNSGGTVIQDVTLDSYGHLTALGSVNLDYRYVQGTSIYDGNKFTYVDVADLGTYTISTTDNYIIRGGKDAVITLPSSPRDGQIVVLKAKSYSGTYDIDDQPYLYVPGGFAKIYNRSNSGNSSYKPLNEQTGTLIYNSTAGFWFVTAESDLPALVDLNGDKGVLTLSYPEFELNWESTRTWYDVVGNPVGTPPSGYTNGPAYNTGWDSDASNNYARLKYYKDEHDRVHFEGWTERTSGGSLLVFTLPSGFRPMYERRFSVVDSNFDHPSVRVYDNGTVYISNYVSGTRVYLDGVSFIAGQ